MSRWTVVPLQRSLGAFADAWDALNERAFGNHPMLSSLFVEGLLRNFGDGTERLCQLEAQGQVQAMCIVKPSGPFMWTSFLPSQAQIGPTLMADATQLPQLLSRLPFFAFGLDLLCNDPAVGGVVSHSLPPTQRTNHALTMNISLEASFPTYWSGRSRNLQSNINRYLKRVQTDNISWRLAIVASPIEIFGATSRYADLEAIGWKGTAGTALPSDPAQLAFYVELMQGAAQRDEARIFELWFGDTLVASRLAVVKNGVLIMLKTSYLESMAQYSPGRLLQRMVIEHAFDAWPNGRIEFYTDANQDQLAWATGDRWMQHATLLRWPSLAIILAAMRVLRGSRYMRNTHFSKETSVEVFHHPDALPQDVQALLARAEKHNLELGVAWYRNLVDTVYPSHPGLRFYVLRHEGQAVAVLPLRAEKARLGWHLKSLSNYYTALYEPALAVGLKPFELATLLRAIRLDFPGAASMTFSPMDPSCHAYQTLLAAFRLKGWLAFEFFAFGNWHLPVANTWSDYLANPLPHSCGS